MKQFLTNELLRAKRNQGNICYAILDIDIFKSVNDTYGHSVGDVVIKSLARLLRQRLRATDIIGRLGGEEFGVILPDTGIDRATEVFDQIRIAFEDIRHTAKAEKFSVTFSAGISQYTDHMEPVAMSEAADEALYVAKTTGRNRIVRAELST